MLPSKEKYILRGFVLTPFSACTHQINHQANINDTKKPSTPPQTHPRHTSSSQNTLKNQLKPAENTRISPQTPLTRLLPAEIQGSRYAKRPQLQQVKTEAAENQLHPNPGQRRNQHPPTVEHPLDNRKRPLNRTPLQPDPSIP
jgi:hypothetical protein